MKWANISDILLKSIQSKPGIRNKLQAGFLKEDLQKKFGIDIDKISFRGNKMEIRVNSPILAQELSFRKEEIKEEAEKSQGKRIRRVEIKIG